GYVWDASMRPRAESVLPSRLPPFRQTQVSPDASNLPTPRRASYPSDASAHYAANDDGDDDVLSVALRTANDIIARATPLKIMLIPTSVPIAQAELDGHCA